MNLFGGRGGRVGGREGSDGGRDGTEGGGGGKGWMTVIHYSNRYVK